MKQEDILVVKRSTLLGNNSWQGLNLADPEKHLASINTHKEFLPRNLMEQDESYKQIIPYLIFQYQDRYFLMQRKSSAGESRLKNKYTLGIGGHIRQEDTTDSLSIFNWAKREFHEEISYNDNFDIKTIGMLNDDSNSVGRVHIGLILLIKGTSANIKIKSELKNGRLLTLKKLANHYDQMETWSQIIFDHLKNV